MSPKVVPFVRRATERVAAKRVGEPIEICKLRCLESDRWDDGFAVAMNDDSSHAIYAEVGITDVTHEPEGRRRVKTALLMIAAAGAAAAVTAAVLRHSQAS